MINHQNTPLERKGILPPAELLHSISEQHEMPAETFMAAVFTNPKTGELDINRYLDMPPEKITQMTRQMNEDARSSGVDGYTTSADIDNHIDFISACWGILGQYFARLAAKDGLTGLFNKTAFEDAMRDTLLQLEKRRDLPEEKRSSALINKSATLIDIDLDRFKPFNDILGHGVGDDALIATADLLKDFTRPSDYSGRLGGDEFSLLLVDVDATDAQKILMRLVEEFEKLHLSLPLDKPITMSDENLAKISRTQQEIWSADDLSVEEYRILGLNVQKTKCSLLVSIDGSFGQAMFEAGHSIDEIDAEADRDMYRYKNEKRGQFSDYKR